MLQISVSGCDCLSGKHTITARDQTTAAFPTGFKFKWTALLIHYNRFHNLRNIHIMIVLFRIELAVSVLIDKICRIHGCAVHFAADEDVSTSSNASTRRR